MFIRPAQACSGRKTGTRALESESLRTDVRLSYLSIVGLLLHIAVLLLVQIYPPESVPVANLRGDAPDERESHHRCGCPKDKVDSQTCCCVLNNRSCCGAPAHGAASAGGIGRKRPSSPCIYASGCGGPEQFSADPNGKFTFMSTHFKVALPALFGLLAQPVRNKPESLYSPPPNPPPETAAMVFL